MTSAAHEILSDIVATRPPEEVAHPHGRNVFALDDGVATTDPAYAKRAASIDVEDVGDRRESVIQRELYPPPTEEEAATLRKVVGEIPRTAWLLCLVEFAERASYYGVQWVFSNFMQFPLPPGGNGAGATAPGDEEDTAGALGKGLQFANAFVLLFTFLAYILPIPGAWLADSFLGRFKVILIGVLLCGLSHIIMICGAIPSVLQAGNGIAPFMVSFFLLAIGAGLFKPNVSPLLIDQYKHQKPYVKTLPSGERVIVDPEVTIQRIMLIFYGLVNIGAFFSLATSFSEKYVGYWLAFLLPGIIYFLLPALLWYLNPRLIKNQPDGSVLPNVLRITWTGLTRSRFQFWRRDFLDSAKPSRLREAGITTFGKKTITWTDDDVEDVKRTITACSIFLYYPIWNINDGGVGSVANNQASTMTTDGAPNEVVGNINPFTIIIAVPLLSYVIYPALRKRGIKFGRISRITFGFCLTILSGIAGTVLQYYVYKTSPCGYYATECTLPDGSAGVSPINVWAQTPNQALGALSECFCMVTAYELAYARSPQGMKSVVTGLFLASLALSAALGEVLTPVIQDPYLIWVWGGPTIALAVQTVIFWYRYKEFNDDEFMLEHAIEPVNRAQLGLEQDDSEDGTLTGEKTGKVE